MEHTLSKNNIFCIWSCENDMSINRKKCLDSLIYNSGCNITVVSPYNINEFIVDKYPLHDAYEFLSCTHKADYLRAYLMYHHGGGYTDIKFNNYNWNNYFNILTNNTKQFLGYAELRPEHIASTNPLIKNNFYKLAGVVHFIFKKHSQIAKLWLSKVNDILDNKYSSLKKNPGHYHPRAVYGGAFQTNLFKGSKYPLHWNEILGAIFHEICYYNIDSYDLVMHYPNTLNYR